MKNNKGITLTSLVIYIALIFVILAILMRITTYFGNNIEDVANVSFETEFNKLNLYLLDEAKTLENIISVISEDGTQISFSNGNTYLYNVEDKAIYLKGTIKICENIESCLFEQSIAENGKKVLSLTITINDIEKTVNYVITTKNEEEVIIAEEDYIIEKDEFKLSYKQVEYIESTGTQYIDTGIPQNEISEISGEIQFTNFGNSHQGICGRYTSNYTSVNLVYNTNDNNIGYRWGANNHSISADLNKHSFTLNLESITIDDTTYSTYTSEPLADTDTLVIFARRTDNSGTSIINLASLKLYKFQIKSGDTIVRKFVPCYRKSDNVAGLYDTVNDVFYTNAGTGEFTVGSEVNN